MVPIRAQGTTNIFLLENMRPPKNAWAGKKHGFVEANIGPTYGELLIVRKIKINRYFSKFHLILFFFF